MIRYASLVGNKVVDTPNRKFRCRWISVVNSSETELRSLKELHLPAKEAISMKTMQALPEVEGMHGKSVIIIKIPGVSEKGKYRLRTIAVLLGKKEFVSYSDIDLIPKLFSEEDLKTALKKGPTFILVNLLEHVLSSYFDIITELDVVNNKLEEEAVHEQAVMETIFHLKRSLGFLHRALNSNRNLVLSLENGLVKNTGSKYNAYFRNQYNDFMELIDLIATYRDGLSTTLELYMSTVSNNLNVIMKRMTALGALILVPTLIAGIYGMNYKYMPELGWKYGYAWAIGLMIVSVTLLSLYFKKKNYL